MSAPENGPVKILLVEDNAGDARLIREALAEDRRAAYELTWVERLNQGIEKLNAGEFDLVLLDLALPDSRGLETLGRLRASAPAAPVVVLTGLDDEEAAYAAVRDGAQDYLVKGRLDGYSLVRSVRYARERARLLARLRELSSTDELTGLYNRRGFLMLAHQQLKIARRTQQGSVLFFADLDDMKRINDTYGHPEGDRALSEAAAVLRATFRDSDILSRIGGDEFVALSITASEQGVAGLRARLRRKLEEHNARPGRSYELKLSVGVVRFDPKRDVSLEGLLAQADRALYEEKRRGPAYTGAE